MATKKKTSKRRVSKRTATPRRPNIEVAHKTELSFALDADKVEAIKRCLEKGTLTITMTKVDLNEVGRADEPYLYD